MQRNTPPFRADHVGSLLRPAPLKMPGETRKGEITDAQLTEVENREIDKIIASRRRWASSSPLTASSAAPVAVRFLQGLDGSSCIRSARHPVRRRHHQGRERPRDRKVGFTSHPHVEHFKYLKAHSKATPKMTIPAPSTLHFRQGRPSVDKKLYPSSTRISTDVAMAYRKAIRAFYDAGCRYLQMDDTAWSRVRSEGGEHSKQRGDDPIHCLRNTPR